jgi:isocitrate dehydrogenase (NAD+)
MRRCLLGAASAVKASAKGPQSFSCREASTVTLFPGDGIGPEIADSVKKVYTAAGIDIGWDEQLVGTTADPRTNSMVTRENLDSVLVSALQKSMLLCPVTTSSFHSPS